MGEFDSVRDKSKGTRTNSWRHWLKQSKQHRCVLYPRHCCVGMRRPIKHRLHHHEEKPWSVDIKSVLGIVLSFFSKGFLSFRDLFHLSFPRNSPWDKDLNGSSYWGDAENTSRGSGFRGWIMSPQKKEKKELEFEKNYKGLILHSKRKISVRISIIHCNNIHQGKFS